LALSGSGGENPGDPKSIELRFIVRLVDESAGLTVAPANPAGPDSVRRGIGGSSCPSTAPTPLNGHGEHLHWRLYQQLGHRQKKELVQSLA
jgi:hypothetical protein